MKTKSIVMTIMLVVFSAGTGMAADADSNDIRPYIGVMLDPAPLPDLLIKHLNLAPGQGIRIANIHRGSPADKARRVVLRVEDAHPAGDRGARGKPSTGEEEQGKG